METIELRQFVKPLLRWWWLLLLSTAIAAASSFAYFSTQPDRYQSRASLMVGGSIRDPNPNGYEFYLSQQLINTYSDLISRQSVRGLTMEALGLTWLPGYSARAVPNTQLMELVVTDSDPVRAQAVAAELIRQLIATSPAGAEEQQRQEFISGELDELQAGIEETKDEIKRKRDELTNLFSARQIADAQNQINALQQKLQGLQTNFTALLSTTQEGAVNAITVIEEPRQGAPLGNDITMNLLLAAAVGFVLAAGGAYLLEYLDDTVKNSDDVEKELGVSAIGAVPIFDDSKDEHQLVMATRTHSPPAEAFRVLRTNLQFAAVANPLDTLLVTSASPGEGKTSVSANLAMAIAQAGRRVVLIDADMHRPRQHRVFGVSNNIGLTTALLGDLDNLDPFLQPTIVPTLRVLTTGPLPPNPAELLGSQRMHDLLERLKAQTDIIIIDSPPTTAVADTAVLASQADGVLLVLYTGKTRREMARRARSALEQVGAHVVGAVLNRMPSRGSGYYYYYHYNYYRQYYRRDDEVSTSAADIIPPTPRDASASTGGSKDVRPSIFPPKAKSRHTPQNGSEGEKEPTPAPAGRP